MHADSNDTAESRADLMIDPPCSAWQQLLAHNKSPVATQFRQELGLPTDRPLIMTGHQALFWHPGILAKFLAADAAAKVFGAKVAWLVVDQDAPAAVPVRYPARDGEGRLVVRTREYTLAGWAGPMPREGEVLPSVAAGLERIERAMAGSPRSEHLAERVAAALGRLMQPLLREDAAPPMVMATHLAETTFFGELVERMKREPERACGIYNAAVARHPAAGMRPLLFNRVQEQYELPLWHISPTGVRKRVYAETLDNVPRHELAPRALLLTGLIRMAGCDLFIHGTGGGGAGGEEPHEGYDRVMEDWLSAWLGVLSRDLPPAVVVTATLRLPLENGDAPTSEEAARAVWRAHHARHDPALLGDSALAGMKMDIVRRIRAAPRNERGALFEQLQTLLRRFREEHSADLADIARHADTARHRVTEAQIARDRTWAFPLYPQPMLDSLRREIEMCFGTGGEA